MSMPGALDDGSLGPGYQVGRRSVLGTEELPFLVDDGLGVACADDGVGVGAAFTNDGFGASFCCGLMKS